MRTWIGLSSNLGDRAAQLRRAAERIAEVAQPGSLHCSHIYETLPWGIEEQPLFLNAVAVCETSRSAPDLLSFLKGVERAFGREAAPRWGPRVLDLDLLDVGGRVLESPDLVLPHPRIAERSFVLVPLCEIDPDWRDPRDGRSAAQMLASLDPDPAAARAVGRIPVPIDPRSGNAR